MDNHAQMRFRVDWDADGTLDDPLEDVTDDVIEASWNLGMRQPYQLVSDETKLRLVLENVGRQYSPEYAGGALYGNLLPLRAVEAASFSYVVGEDGGTAIGEDGGTAIGGTASQWYGWIDRITPSPGATSGPFQSVIEAVSMKQFLQAAEPHLPLLEDVTADEILDLVMDSVIFSPSMLRGAGWALGVAGRSELGETTYLGSPGQFFDFNAGKNIYPYVGDNFDKFNTAWTVVKQVVEAERGRFFFDREGVAVFRNRDWLQQATAVAGTVDVLHGLGYSFGGDIVNDARVNLYPRAIESDVVLWQLDEPLRLKPGQERTVRARFAAADGQQVAGRNVQQPNTANGTLEVAKGTVTFVEFEADARSASMTFKNEHKSQDRTITVLTVRGDKITSWNALEMASEDGESIAYYGRRAETFDLRLLNDDTFAQMAADYVVYQQKDPRGTARSITLLNRDAARLAQMRDFTIGDRIVVSEAQTAHTGTYFIVGEEHDWRERGTRYRTTWTLEPAARYDAWLLGVASRSELGETTLLGL